MDPQQGTEAGNQGDLRFVRYRRRGSFDSKELKVAMRALGFEPKKEEIQSRAPPKPKVKKEKKKSINDNLNESEVDKLPVFEQRKYKTR